MTTESSYVDCHEPRLEADAATSFRVERRLASAEYPTRPAAATKVGRIGNPSYKDAP